VRSTTVALDRLRLRVAAGAPPGGLAELPERCRRALRVAERVGAPMLDAVDAAQAAQDDADRARRAVTVASAQTRVVALGLLVAPLLLVPGLSRLVGADLVAFYGTGLGLTVLAVGSVLLAVGAAAVWLLVRRVGRAATSPRRTGPGRPGGVATLAAVVAGVTAWWVVGVAVAPLTVVLVHHLVARRAGATETVVGVDEAADLAATALAGGVAAAEALRLTADELTELAPRLRRLAFGLELGMDAEAFHGDDPVGRLGAIMATAQDSGAPVAPTLRHLARELRADDLARVLAAAERLPAQLTFPTALCLLPATVLLIGAPIVHAGLTAAGT
jgi:Flp pilus assembly protein TadB